MKTKTEINNLALIKKLNGKIKFIYNKTTSKIKTIAVLKLNNRYFIGEAKRSLKDVFSKKIGRAIALGRAIKKYDNDMYMDIKHIAPYHRFKEDME